MNRRPDELTPRLDELPDDDIVMALLERALEEPEAHREAALRTWCQGQTQLFEEVCRCAAWEGRVRGLLEESLLQFLAPEAGFASGELVSDRFLVVRELARGGMGVVYEAWDQTLQRRVALKCARRGFGRRLPPEARNATTVIHPNVCRVFEIYQTRRGDEVADFLSMELLEGETLAQRLRRGRLAQGDARAIAIQLCEGLAEAHRRGVVHGDLKANNVMLAKADDGSIRAVITDFGLARRATGADPSLGPAGTPGYMAPELWDGAACSTSTDIYALGVLLFELACGRQPFGPDVSGEALRQGPVPAAHPAWDSVLVRCLAPRPERRFPRVERVRDALNRRRRLRRVALVATAVGLGAVMAWSLVSRSGGEPSSSIAVIPFVSDPLPAGSQHLPDAIADSLIHALSRLPGAKVIARSSASQFRGEPRDLRQIARRLDASFLVTGRVSMAAGRLRVSVELIHGPQGSQLWGDRYTADLADLAALDERIARQLAQQIAVQIGAELPPSAVTRLSRGQRVKPEAYELLLRGQYQRRLYTPESRHKAIGYFEQALVVDPQYALAHAELANIYRLLGGGGILDPAESMPKVEASVRRALAADPNLADAHFVLADLSKDRWQWAAAELEYRRAIELNPSLADAHMGYAILLSVLGRHEAAIAEVQTVRRLDPVGLPGALHAAAVHYNGRRYAEALQELTRARALDPAASMPWMWMGMVYGGSGRYRQAVDAYEQAIALGDDTGATQGFYAFALAKAGQRERAEGVLNRLRQGHGFVPLTALAVAHLGLDRVDEAIRLLRDSYVRPDPLLQYLKVESHFDGLQTRAEYRDLAARVGLP